ncbi:MAG: hypothetical protein LAT84_09900 [Balneolia bacterium]|nr:hypothetical protein [Balneolia bacterium]
MNLNLVLSFAIGGMLLLSLLSLSMTMSNHSVESTFNIINQGELDNLTFQISNDLNRMGYSPGGGNEPPRIIDARQDFVHFQADIAGTGVREVTWELVDTTLSHPNPDLKILRRVGTLGPGFPDTHTLNYPVIDFKLTPYSDFAGTVPATGLNEVRSVLVEVVFESKERVRFRGNAEGEFPRTYWRKLFVPKNLQLQSTY